MFSAHPRGVVAPVAMTLCLSLLLPVAALAAGAAPRMLSLHDAVQLAVERAPMLDARRAQVEAARQESHRAGALPDPMLMVGIDNLPVTGIDAFDTGADFMTMKKIGLRQEIPARAKRDAQRTLAARTVDEADARARAELLAVRRATAEAWVDLWTAQHELMALQALREQATLATRLARARIAGGASSIDDALAAAAAGLELDNRIEEGRGMQASAQAVLARWLGDDVEASHDAPDFATLPVAESQLLADIDRSGPLLPIAAQLETAAAQVDVARAEKRPDWSVAASYGQRERGRSDMLMVEVGIGLPLFPRNRQDRDVAAREADYQAALAAREDARRQRLAQLRADLARWHALQRQVALHEDSLLPLARDRSKVALAAYRAGGDLQPWLRAERDELEVHVSHAEHLGELGHAWAALAYLLPSETKP